MPCALVALSLFVPRLVIAGLYLFSDWFADIFATPLWPILGFFFAPTTLLWYTVVANVYGGIWDTWHVFVMVVAILIDLSPASGKKKK